MESGFSHLAKELKEGNTKAFDRIFYMYHQKVLLFCQKYGLPKEDAEEVLQEAFVKLWTSRERLDTEKELAPYLFKISKNLIIDTFKKRIKEQAAFSYQMTLVVPVNDVEEKMNHQELVDQFRQVLDKLPEKRRMVFEMARINGLSIKEISIKLGISPKTVENHMTLAIQDVEKTFQKIRSLVALLFLSCLL